MNEVEQKTYDRLLDKSQEAFLLAIELYNRPTIRYHAEGCSFFLCNAWELMLKAAIVKNDGAAAIYYPGKDRTLSLEDCLKRLFTNENDPLRRYMDIIIDLRNTSTHFVTDEYELFYGPVLQTCVSYYDSKLSELHGIEISDRIPENYLALSVRRGDIDLERIRARYDKSVVEKMLRLGSDVVAAGAGMAPGYATELRLTKKQTADISVRIDPDADTAVAILHSLTNPVDKYRYRFKTGARFVDSKLQKEGIRPWFKGEEKDRFNTFHFGVFSDFYEMRGNERYTYDFSLKDEEPSWGYSQQAVDLMIQEVRRDPVHVIDRMREELAKRTKEQSRPQEQGNSKQS